MELNIEKFNPTKAQIIKLVSSCKVLEIKGIEDKEGYDNVKSAIVSLRTIRKNIQDTGKSMRADALKFQKDVIAKEREYTDMIEPIEQDLKEKKEYIDDEKEKIKRKDLLPERLEKLQKINVIISNDEILLMDDKEFTTFYNDKNTEFLAEKERLIQEEKDKIEIEKKELERAKELEEAKKKAAEEAIEEEKYRAAKQKEIEEQGIANENARIARENEEKEKAEKAALEKKEKNKKYVNWLSKNGYNEENKVEFHIIREGDKFTLYKKLDSIIIK